MKCFFISLFAVAGLLSTVGCGRDVIPEKITDHAVRFTINTSAPETKTYIEYDGTDTYTPYWHSSDKIGVFFGTWDANASLQTTFSNTLPDGRKGSFSGQGTVSSTEQTIYAFYPAGAFAKTYADQKLGVTIPAIQKPTATSFDKDADILINRPYPITITNSSVVINDMHFTRVLSLLKVVVIDGTSGNSISADKIKSISITSEMDNAALTGRYVWDFVNETGAINNEAKSPTVTADLSANPISIDGESPIYLLVNPTTLSSGSRLTVNITTDRHEITKNATLPKAFVFPAGQVANLSITIHDSDNIETPVVEPTGTGWYLVEDVSWLRAGDRVVIANASSEMAIGAKQNNNNRSAVAVVRNSDGTLNIQTAMPFTLANGKLEGTFAFQDPNTSKYLYYASDGNYLRSGDLRNNASWNITITSTTTQIDNAATPGRKIKYNANNGSPIFSCYTAQQTDVLIYKEYTGTSGGKTITALKTDITNVAAGGVSAATETGVYSLANATDDDLTVTTDGTVVTSASAASGNVTYDVAANSGDTREGWIRIAVSGGNEIEITVSQLNPWATVYTSNVTMTNGTNSSSAQVGIDGTNFDAIKVGTGSSAGDMTITVPANTTKLYIHAAFWNNVTDFSIRLSSNNASINPTSISPKANSGIINNPPFTFSGDPFSSNYFFEITLSDSDSPTTLTFSADRRFVIWGCNVNDPSSTPTTLVTTGAATVHSASAATLTGSFSGATGTVMASGFLWGESENNLDHDIQLGSQTGTGGTLEYELTNGLMAGTMYYYKAYVQVWDEDTQTAVPVYGTVRSFMTWMDGGDVPAGWLELPAVTGDEDFLGVFYGSGGTTASNRNYSYNYNYTHYACLWVAYPLIAAQTTGSAKSSWDYNPYIDKDKQIWVVDNSYGTHYNNSVYSRGHQIPNGDRKSDATMNAQTYLVTNQTPQRQDDFNATIWNELEIAARTEAGKTDTLYIVTGACYQTVGGNETINRLTGVQSEQKPTNPMSLDIPNYYWKALLKVQRSGNTVVAASAIGFWFKHESYGTSKDYTPYAVSVDEIESKTGFDLFTYLPEALQTQAEANTSWSDFQQFGR